MRKLAKICNCSCVVCACGRNQSFFRVREAAKTLSDPIDGYSCSPILSRTLNSKGNSFIWATSETLMLAILGVFTSSAAPKILVGIIKRIAVFMIARDVWFVENAQNHAMHENDAPLTVSADEIGFGVKRLFARMPKCVPLVRIQIVEAVRAYFRKLTLGEGNETIIFRRGHTRNCLRVGFVRRLQRLTPLFYIIFAAPLFAQQLAPIQGHSFLGGTQAQVSGLPSTNYLQGVVPSATITVYLTGTQTLATIYSDAKGDPLPNPFTSNAVGTTNPGGYVFWAATGQAYDVIASGGIYPNVYPVSVPLQVDVSPGGQVGGPFLPLSGGTLTGPLNGTSATFGNASISTNLSVGSSINNDQYVTSTNSLSAANAALATTGGNIRQNIPISLSSVQPIGTSSYPVQWLPGITQGAVTLNTGGGIQLCNASYFNGPTTFEPSGGPGLFPGTVVISGSASVADAIAPCLNNTTQEAMGITNISVLNSSGSTAINFTGTITSGSNSITGVSLPSGASIAVGNLVTGTAFLPGTQIASISGSTITLTQNAIANATSATIRGAQIHSSGLFSGTVLRNISGSQVNTGVGLLIDGGVYTSGSFSGKPAFSTDVEVDGYRFWGARPNNSGLPVVAVWSTPNTPGGAGITNLTLGHGDVEGCSAGNPLMDINGFSAGTAGGEINGVYGYTLDLEAHPSSGSCPGLRIQDAHKVEITNITAEAPGTQSGPIADNNIAAAVVINETYPFSTTKVHVNGYNANWPTTILDWVGAADFVNLNASVSAGCTTLTVPYIPPGTAAPLAGQPIEIMDGANTEVVYAAYGTGTGTTINVASPYCQYAHTTSAYVVWNPKWIAGPGPSGLYQGVQYISAGSMVNDGSGVVTVTVTGDNYVYEERHIGEYVTVSASSSDAQFELGRVQITGLGSYCTISGAQGTCGNNQFQFISPTHVAYTNTNTVTLLYDVQVSFDYYEPGDSVPLGSNYAVVNGVNLSKISGSLDVGNGAQPAHISISGYDSNNHSFLNKLFIGYNNPSSGAVSTDAYLETQYNTFSGAPVVAPAFHLRTGPGTSQPLFLGVNGTDYFKIDPSSGLLQQIGSNYNVAIMNGTPNTNDVLYTCSTIPRLCDSGIAYTNIAQVNASSVQNFSSGLKTTVYTVSTLPSASSVPPGTMLEVSDATSFTPGTCTGGGSDYMLAISNGTSWSCH